MYRINARKKEYFLITPKEFSSVFNGFSFVVANTGVKPGYTVSETDAVINQYGELYKLLESGKRCVWADDHSLLGFNTGVTAHPENCIYSRKDKGLLVPDFLEPCIELSVFCAVPFGNLPVSKGWLLAQFPQYAFGLELSFPSKITYVDETVKLFEQLADHETWDVLIHRIRAVAHILYIEDNGKRFNTRIRVSQEAKTSLAGFNAVLENGFRLL